MAEIQTQENKTQQSPVLASQPQKRSLQKIETLIDMAEEQRESGQRELARRLLQIALKLEAGNERATFSLCKMTKDHIEVMSLLQTMLQYHPKNALGAAVLREVEKRFNTSAELEEMVATSNFLQQWSDKEKRHSERLRFNTDRRAAPVTKLGELLVSSGVIKSQELSAALNLQIMMLQLGNKQKLGQILVDYGYITQKQLSEALQTQVDEYHSQFY